MKRALLVSLSALLLAACAGTPQPLEYTAQDRTILVRAEQQEDAAALLALTQELYPKVAQSPHMLPLRPLELRVRRQSGRYSAGANRWKGDLRQRRESWIEVQLGSDPQQYRWILAHEFTHYLLGDEWLPLPMIVEEGLCDLVAEQLDPATGAQRRMSHAVLLASWLGPGLSVTRTDRATGRMETITLRVNIDREEMPSVVSMLRFDERSYHSIRDPKQNQLLYAFGYLLVSRIGIEKLSALCAQAREAGVDAVPPEWLLAAAGVRPGDEESWKRVVDGLIGGVELEAMEKALTLD